MMKPQTFKITYKNGYVTHHQLDAMLPTIKISKTHYNRTTGELFLTYNIFKCKEYVYQFNDSNARMTWFEYHEV
jgi:hypothetical protein